MSAVDFTLKFFWGGIALKKIPGMSLENKNYCNWTLFWKTVTEQTFNITIKITDSHLPKQLEKIFFFYNFIYLDSKRWCEIHIYNQVVQIHMNQNQKTRCQHPIQNHDSVCQSVMVLNKVMNGMLSAFHFHYISIFICKWMKNRIKWM